MNDGPEIKGNPLKITVVLLTMSYIIGEFFLPKYPLIDFIKLIGIIGLIFSSALFISGFNIFQSYEEDPRPTSDTKRLIKTGIYAYTRNPIYLAFVLFLLSMFLVFENVMYFLSAVALFAWLHNWVIKIEESFLRKKFDFEYEHYQKAVKRWLFF